MSKAGIIVITLGLLALLASCGKDQVVNDPVIPRDPGPVSEAEAKLVAAGNEFTWNLFRHVVEQEAANPNKNVFISPLSASLALGMTYNGARSQTQEAMAAALGFADLTPQQINHAYRDLLDRLAGADSKVTLQIANAIWYTELLNVEQDFIDSNQFYFDAVVRALDFASPEALVTINNWASESTNGKIPTILESIPEEIVMYLMNALYFKGNWTYRFDRDDTKPSSFHCADGTTITCDFMSMTSDSLRYLVDFSDGGLSGLELPYGNGGYRFLVVQPMHPDSSVDRIITRLDGETWTRWLGALHHDDEYIALPKFKLEYSVNLNDALAAMGMAIAFTDFADFSGISRDVGLAISEVKQKTFVQVDEEGTEAAAVTSVGIYPTSAGPSFVFNRPFLVAIYEGSSGAVLFVGKIAKPQF